MYLVENKGDSSSLTGPDVSQDKKDFYFHENKKQVTSPLANNRQKISLGDDLMKELPKSPVFKSIAKDHGIKTSEAGKTRF